MVAYLYLYIMFNNAVLMVSSGAYRPPPTLTVPLVECLNFLNVVYCI